MTTPRRRVLRAAAAAPALGITTLRLPAAAAATSSSTGVGTVADGPRLTPDDTRVVVAWTETDGVTYTVQQDDGEGGWTDVAAAATSPTTVTGLTNDELVTFRIVSESGGVTFEGAGTSTRPRAAAVGGTESVISVDGAAWRVHVFDTAGAHVLAVRAARDVEYLLVAGGGGGGGNWGSTETGYVGGGGGAGGVLHNVGGARVTVSSDLTFSVGAGGAFGATFASGADGEDTAAPGLTATTAFGGGGGGTRDVDGAAGGSGGGAGMNRNGGIKYGGAGTSGQGYGGGRNATGESGGGGGRGGAGGRLTAGAGITLGITGVDVVYAAGGGTPAAGTAAASGTDGTGSGGDGRTRTGGAGNGGCGAAVVRYPI